MAPQRWFAARLILPDSANWRRRPYSGCLVAAWALPLQFATPPARGVIRVAGTRLASNFLHAFNLQADFAQHRDGAITQVPAAEQRSASSFQPPVETDYRTHLEGIMAALRGTTSRPARVSSKFGLVW